MSLLISESSASNKVYVNRNNIAIGLNLLAGAAARWDENIDAGVVEAVAQGIRDLTIALNIIDNA